MLYKYRYACDNVALVRPTAQTSNRSRPMSIYTASRLTKQSCLTKYPAVMKAIKPYLVVPTDLCECGYGL